MRRVPSTELLDDDSGSADEVQASLDDLRSINRWLGGMRTTRIILKRLNAATPKPAYTVLDVGSGRADSIFQATRELREGGVKIDLVLLDRATTHLPRRADAARICGDALALPFRNESVDIVSSSLFVHHFAPEDLTVLLRESFRVCRIGIAINDLTRSRAHLMLATLGRLVFRSRITSNDAVASVRQAYTPFELEQIVQSALPSASIHITRHWLFRMGVSIVKDRNAL